MLSQAHRRLLVDLNKLRKEDSQDFCAQPTDNDIMKWDAWIFGYKIIFKEP